MITFRSAAIVGDAAVTLNAARTDDGRTLSLILEGAECRDRGDRQQRHAALSFDVDVHLEGGPAEPMSIAMRGAEHRSSHNGFSVLRVQAGAVVGRTTGHEAGGGIELRLASTPAGPVLRLSLLLLAQAGRRPSEETLLVVDTIDLAWLNDQPPA